MSRDLGHGDDRLPLPSSSDDAHEALVLPGVLPPMRAAFVWPSTERPDGWRTALFRREFDVANPPGSRRIVVTADNRYILWLNGRRLGRGPLKGTLSRYHAETYELAPLLRPGRNVLAAEVRWWGEHGALSEVHGPAPGFLVQEWNDDELDTPGAWRAIADNAVSPQMEFLVPDAHLFLGPFDRIDARLRPAGWIEPEFDAAHWPAPVTVAALSHTQGWGLAPSHRLHARTLPLLTEASRAFAGAYIARAPASLPWKLEAGAAGEIWLEVDAMTTSYPVFTFEGGRDRIVAFIYAEALGHWENHDGTPVWRKSGRRDDLAAAEPHGYVDQLVLPGGDYVFEPFHWRTFRYLKVIVGAGDTPVTLRSAHHRFTTFPQSFDARFDCADPDTAALWATSRRTLQLCAHETYEDCPYFEQLNYLGDARLQALCSQYLANDTRLGRQALLFHRETLDASGLMASRAPARGRQVIPVFSLHWILMLGDHWRWEGKADQAFVRECLPAVDAVLCHFRSRLTPENFVGRIDGWAWIDWVPGWPRGVAPFAAAGAPSTFLTALFAVAVETAMILHHEAGLPFEALRWRDLQADLRAAIRATWSDAAGCFHEGPGREADPHTEHTQALAILAGAPTDAQAARLAHRLGGDANLVPMSLMYRFYLVQALARLGRLDRLFSHVLAPWRTMLANGLTTWQEMADPSRSDCHAWSSWPAAVFLSDLLGVKPAAPGWTSIVLEPAFHATSHASGELNTPAGRIEVAWSVNPDTHRLNLTALTPPGIPTTLMVPGTDPLVFAQGGPICLKDFTLPAPYQPRA